MEMKKKKGFTLIELILALGVGVIASFIKFQDMRIEQDLMKASAAGQQIQQVGYAVNNYVSLRYDKISTLTSSTSQSSDPGPRTCNTGTSTCTITIQTLKNEGILPDSYTDSNAFKSSYSIVIHRSGTSPNYIVDALVATSSSWIDSGSNPRYDLLGYAMQKAGIDSGMTKATNKADGYGGIWSENSTTFSNINRAGQLVFRAGYNASMYSAYLRRDGTLPMTGNLNMGANDIYNAKDITASGTGNFGGNVGVAGKSASDLPSGWSGVRTQDVGASGTVAVFKSGTTGAAANYAAYMTNSGNIYGSNNITSGGEVVAHNAYGDAITIGGDAAANDYELRLGSGKQLTIYSPNAASYSTVLEVNRNMKVDQRLATNGFDPNNLPAGWGGGVRTYDVYASGTVGVGDDSGNLKAYMNNSGNIYASSNIQSGGTMTANGRLTANEYIQLNGQVTVGASCSPNGLMGRTSDGTLMSCINGVWSSPTGLKQDACYWVGNHNGRDFTAYSCAVGEYAAGLQFTGHRNSESTYMIKCCK